MRVAEKREQRENAGKEFHRTDAAGRKPGRARFQAVCRGALSQPAFRLTKGNGKGGQGLKDAGFHKWRKTGELQNSARRVPPAGQQEDRDDPHANPADKADPTSDVHGLAFFSLSCAP